MTGTKRACVRLWPRPRGGPAGGGGVSEMAEHTKEPWIVERRNWRGEPDPHRYFVSGNLHEDEDGGMVATGVAIVEGNATSGEVTTANARLIGAAPALLTALVDLLERAEAMQEDTLELDDPPFSPGLLANAWRAVNTALGTSLTSGPA
jgi:hypothetical protein